MPITWRQHRSAFVFFLYFPWFPFSPPLPPVAQPPAMTVEAGAAGESQTAASAVEEPLVLPGVVIEEIPEDSALQKAGLQVGDVILSWERLPNPPANPEGASGKIDSPFDWRWVAIEQLPRGKVQLLVERREELIDVLIVTGGQEPVVRPRFRQEAIQWYQAASRAAANSETDPMLESWTRLTEEAHATKSGPLRDWLELTLAKWLNKQKHLDAAEKILSEHIPRVYDCSTRARFLELLGDIFYERNELDKAEAVFSSALAIQQEIWGDSLELASVQERLSGISWKRRNIDEARRLLESSRAIRSRLAPESIDYARSLNNLAAYYLYEGRLSEAEIALQQGVEIAEEHAPEGRLLANLLNNRGMVYYRKGQLDRAESDHTRALEIRSRREPFTLNHASSLNNLGIVLLDRHDLDRGEFYLRSALEIKKSLSKHSLDTAMTLNNLGTLSADRGLVVEAEWYHRQALEIRSRSAPGTMDEAMSMLNLSSILQDQGKYKEAIELLETSVKLYRKIGPKSVELASAINNLANQLAKHGMTSKAQDMYEEALNISGGSEAKSLVASAILRDIGILLERQGKLEKAEDMYRRSLSIRIKTVPSTIEEAESLNSLGLLLWKQGRNSEARELIRRSVQALELQIDGSGISRDLNNNFRSRHREIFIDAAELELNLGNLDQALLFQEIYREETIRVMLAGKDDLLVGELSPWLRDRRKAAFVEYENFLRQRVTRNVRASTEFDDSMLTAVESLRSELRAISVEVAKTSPRLASLEKWKRLQLEDLGAEVEHGTTELIYLSGKHSTNIFVLRQGERLQVTRIPIGTETIRSWTQRLQGLLPEATGPAGQRLGRTERLRSLLANIYKNIVEPCQDAIAQSSRIQIIPDGPLHYLPWGALIRNYEEYGVSKQQYLAEWKPLHVTLSETVFAELKKERRLAESEGVNAESSRVPKLAAFGAPVYPPTLNKDKPEGILDIRVRSAVQRGFLNLAPLPWSRREVEGIAALFPPGHAKIFVGTEATEEEVKMVGKNARILHFATHARVDDRFPLNSALALTMPEGFPQDRDNGLLQVWEIFEKVRFDTDLVVLSACETALGEEQGGEGLIGLTRAFQYAGARTVMASLWSVQDQATSELMIRFYRHLRAGKSKDEALRQAQIEFIRGPIEVVNEKGEKTLFDASAPYYWAGFQIYGDWQ